MTDELPLVHLRHARMIKRINGKPVCRTGIEAICQRIGVDWKAFTTTGVPGQQAIDSGNRFALLALEHAKREKADGQQ